MVQSRIEGRDLQSNIIHILREYECKDVRSLLDILKNRYGPVEVNDVKAALEDLESKNILKLYDPPFNATFTRYLTSIYSLNLWFVVGFTLITLFIIYTLPNLLYLRWSIGGIFALFIPGYTLVKLLFNKSINTPLSIVLSIVLSMAITSIIGLILNYTYIGVRLTPLLIILSIFSISTIFLSLYKDYKRLENYG